jgi:hypothetical protein
MGVQVARHGRITEVEVTWSGAPSAAGLTGHGTAFRSKNDVRLDEIGDTIAIGRALQDLGYQIECSGHAQCVTKDEYARVKHLVDRRSGQALEMAFQAVKDEPDRRFYRKNRQ